MAALTTVGEWFGQGIVQTLIDKISDVAIQNFAGDSDLQGNLKSLKQSLIKIHTLLKIADEKKNESDGLAGLMVELRDVYYDAGDFLDEIDYQALKKNIENNNNREARNFLSSALISTNDYLAERKYISEAVGRVREIQERLDSVASGMKEIIELLSYSSKKIKLSALDETTPGNRDTSSVLEVPETEVFGRDEEREDMIKYLLNSADESGSTNNNISVLAVIGIGGVGKTTLAQLVYNDMKVTGYFQLKMWVCVSENFNVQRLTTMMIGSTNEQNQSDLTSLDAIQSKLREIVKSKRFLLVLDDIWNLNSDQWERLCAPLLASAQGSKILVTTRFENVAEATEITRTMKTIFLNGLQDESYWKLFRKYAFGSHKSEEHPQLEAIGKEIAEKLRGSPLAARVMGILLRKKLDVTYWRSILNKKPWTKEEGIIGVLRLSYDYLPEHLKRCFAYSAVFPKDYHFKEEELVYLWMAQGFIRPQRDMRMEDTGKGYFHVLISSYFFQKIEPDFVDKDKYYIMHDLIHDLSQIVFEGEFVRVESDRSHGNSSIARHVSVSRVETDLSELCNNYKLRSLFAQEVHNIFHIISFERLSSIRSLILRDCKLMQLPDNIGDLILLRYLDVSFNSGLKELPESICRLYNLQVLKLMGCYYLKCFPQGMSNLINLRLLNYKSEELGSSMANIGKLTSLQSMPAALTIRKEKGHRITELKDMTQLHGLLHIEALENVDSKEEAGEAKLDNKEHLEELKLEWSVCNTTSVESNHLEVLEGLRPHENLQSLTITRYAGVRSPDWLDKLLLSNLTTITLEKCLWWEEIQSLAEREKFLPSLQKIFIARCPKLESFRSLPPSLIDLHLSSVGLRVLGFSTVNQIDGERQGRQGLRMLEYLIVSDMPNWEEWSVESGREAFPCLRHLDLRDCPKLKWLPTLSRELKYLSLTEVGVAALPGLWEGNVGSALQEMYILGCVELVSFPMESFTDFIRLRKLRIRDCPKLCMPVKPDEDSSILLPQLQILELTDCGQICKAILECLHNLTSLVKLTIERCHDIKSLSRRKLIHLTRLQVVKIIDCKELRSIDGLQGLKSIKGMQILECPKLADASNIVHSESEVEEEQQQQQAEMSIEYLRVHLNDIAQLKLSAIRGMSSSLKSLHIERSLRVVMFDGEEEFLQSLKSLERLEISHCNNLQNIELHALPSLLILKVSDCPNLELLQDKGLPATLRGLQLKRCQKFQSLPAELHTIPLEVLYIYGCPNMESLPEKGLPATLRKLDLERCKKLQSLPSELHTIPLQRLLINCCPKIQMLPEKGLPESIKRLDFSGCHPMLSEQLRSYEAEMMKRLS